VFSQKSFGENFFEQMSHVVRLKGIIVKKVEFGDSLIQPLTQKISKAD